MHTLIHKISKPISNKLRCFSTVNSHLSTYPYKFQNTSILNIPSSEIEEFRESEDINYIKHGFEFAYHSLLNMISEGSSQGIKDCLESKLALNFNKMIENLQNEGYEVLLMNRKNYDFDIKLLGIESILGTMKINREGNIYKLPKISKAIHVYFAKELENPLIMNIILQIPCKIRTTLKLNLRKDGNSLIEKTEKKDVEIHYAQFSGYLKRIECPVSLNPLLYIKTMKNNLSNLRVDIRNVEGWTITDFDNYLNGNPYV